MEKSFEDFGWNSTLSASEQAAIVQSALDSGEPLLAPVGTVTIDAPLVMDHTTSLRGNGNSLFRTADPDIDMLWVRSDYTKIEGLDLDRTVSENLTGAAIKVGPKADGSFAIYDTLLRNRIGHNNHFGIHAQKFGGLTIQGGMAGGKKAALRWDNEVVDTGDSKIIGVDINADNESGAGLWWTSGGGLYITECKFNQGHNHVRIDHRLDNTGSIMLHGNSLEGNTPISIDIMGSLLFNRMHIVNNSIGVLGVALAVRNFNPAGGDPTAWLHGLLVANNTIEAGFNDSPLMDIGCCTDPLIGPNRLQGRGAKPPGIIIRQQCMGGKVDINGSVITGCSPVYENYGNGTVVI